MPTDFMMSNGAADRPVRAARPRPRTPSLPLPPPRVTALMVILLLVLCALPAPALAQEGDAWNSARTLDLVERARGTRAALRGAEGLASYSAHAEGHIYFFVDPVEGDRALIRVDQVALETYWMAPDFTKQVVVGLREETRLPVRDFHYFVDRLSVIQNNFDDVIRVGEGNDVAGAPHPLAVRRADRTDAGARTADPGEPYDFRIADSVTIRLPGGQDPVRVYRVDVRPRDRTVPGVVGSVNLDRASASIVRMDFTFTPASYTDRRNDWIRISIDHGLWEGRHWLPNQQRIEVRREIPEFDIGAGTVIRAVMRVTDYNLNVPMDEDFFAGRPVVARPQAVREQYPFDEGLLERVGEEGLLDADRHLDPRQIRAQAAELMRSRVATGMPPLRFHVPAISSVARFNRAEGFYVGAGGVYSPDAPLQLRGGAGYAFGPGRIALRGEIRTDLRPTLGVRLGAWRNRLVDIGPAAGSSGLLNSLAGASTGRDYLDPYFAHGAELGVERSREGPWSQSLSFAIEEHRNAGWMRASAPFHDGSDFRPIRPVEEGVRLSARLDVRRAGDPLLLRSRRFGAGVEGGAWEGAGYARARLAAGMTLRTPGFERSIDVDVHAGTNVGETPPQHLFLLGGRQTLPGFPYRGFAGDHYARVSADMAHDLFGGQWLRLHLLGWAGWSHLAEAPPAGWDVADTDGVRAALGAGVGVFYDILRVDVVRGLDGGEWQLLFSIDPLWWDRL